MRQEERSPGDGPDADGARRDGLTPGGAARYRFPPFELDAATGELRRLGEESAGVRLPPQPTRLLLHLIERRPHLVTRREIRELLWPGVSVEFDESLHTCIRKIRLALDDSAADPRFVETVPRRGYRFVGAVEGGDAAAVGARPPRRRWLATAAMAAVVTALIAWGALRGPATRPAMRLRVGVMPFEPRARDSALAPGNDLAESLVALLANDGRGLDVVGPTTTRDYVDRERAIPELLADLDLDYLINARETTGESGPRALVEIIRAGDGAHVWVRFLDELPPGRVAETIAGALPRG